MARTITITSPAMPSLQGQPALEFKSLHGSEALGNLFCYTLELQTPDSPALTEAVTANVAVKDLVGKDFSIVIQLDGKGPAGTGAGTREINGLVTRARYVGSQDRRSFYEVVVEPWLTLATRTSDYKIFQNLSALEIVQQVLADYSYPTDARVSHSYPKRVFQVQYGESDYDFICRLMQEWGIYFFFEHKGGKHTLVLVDDAGAHKPYDSEAYQTVNYYGQKAKIDEEYCAYFDSADTLRSGQWVTDDFDFTKPKAKLQKNSKMPRNTGNADQEMYKWPGDYAEPAEGEQLVRIRMEEAGAPGKRARGTGNLRAMVPGCTFTLAKHPQDKSNRDWLIIGASLQMQESGHASGQEGYHCHTEFHVQPASDTFRSPRAQSKPHTRGPQTAIVTGPAGQDIHTNEYGQVKVHFHWDRYNGFDENSSCWIRVASPWAGGQLGGIHIPRIGQEVIVDFESGDPDRPIIIGRVWDQLNMPPWKLPDQSALSSYRSRELTGGGGNSNGGRSNHLVMDDTQKKIQTQLKSDHASTSLSLGHITRIEDNAGRKDARGEGFELRSDAHGAIRAQQGLLISTEARPNAQAHILDSKETQQRLIEARDLHFSAADLAQQNKGQESGDQRKVAEALKDQNDAIKGDGPGNPAEGQFPELAKPHLVFASPVGIESTSQLSTHIASGEHTAITSGKHTSLVSGDSVLAVALQAIKLFAAQKGIHVLAAQADIEIQALKTCINLAAKDQITLKADKIRIEAVSELLVTGGGSYTQYRGGGIESGTSGAHVRHASMHSMVGPSSKGNPALPAGQPPGKGQLEITNRYANNQGLKGADFQVTDALGQVKTGKLDNNGFAAVSGLAMGAATVTLGKDPRNPWDEASYFGDPKWPAKEPVAGAEGDGQSQDSGADGGLMDKLMKQAGPAGAAAASGALSGLSGLAGSALSGGNPMKALSGAVSGMASQGLGALAGNVTGALGLGAGTGSALGSLAGAAVSGNLAGAATNLALGTATQQLGGLVGSAANQAMGAVSSAVGGTAVAGALGSLGTSVATSATSALTGAASKAVGNTLSGLPGAATSAQLPPGISLMKTLA